MADKKDKTRQEFRLAREQDLRNAVGQAVIDGLLSPKGFVRTNGDGYYNQDTGDYEQSGGFHDQVNGGYSQKP